MKNTIFGAIEETYLGATEVHNTTFPNLVKMVKQDCSQFQQGHGDYYGDELAWIYSPYDPSLDEKKERFDFSDEERDEFQEKLLNGDFQTAEDMKAFLRKLGMSEEELTEINNQLLMFEIQIQNRDKGQ